MWFQFDAENAATLHEDDFSDGFGRWHHEGVGEIATSPEGGMRLHCFGSRQGAEGCMAFFRPNLPDQIAVEYDLTIRSHGGLVINYLAIRGQNGEDIIEDRDKLEPRTGVMRNYFANRWGLQSYHVSISRFNDAGEHTGTCNWRRNPGMMLVGHGTDPVTEIGRTFRIRIVKDRGHCHMKVNDVAIHGFVDRDTTRPIPDHGKFGFRLIGSDVMADVANFKVYQINSNPQVWRDGSGED